MQKTIKVDNWELIVCGNPGDRYFDFFDLGDHTNDFLLYAVKHIVPNDAVVLDIGANIGVMAAILATKAQHGNVYAFEPDAAAYPYLEAMIEANRLKNCHPRQIALGKNAGEASFHANPLTSAHSHLAFDGVSMRDATARVKVETMDEVVAELGLSRLDFIKIDVEGLELDVLAGGKETLAKFKPRVFLEFNSFTLIAYGNQNPRHVLEHLKSMFPHVYSFVDGQAHELVSEPDMHLFIHDNLVQHGCVDDVLCSYEPLVIPYGFMYKEALAQQAQTKREHEDTKKKYEETKQELAEANWKLAVAVKDMEEATRQLNDVKRYTALKQSLRVLLRRE